MCPSQKNTCCFKEVTYRGRKNFSCENESLLYWSILVVMESFHKATFSLLHKQFGAKAVYYFEF